MVHSGFASANCRREAGATRAGLGRTVAHEGERA
jgi:hypothetical protein